MPSDEKGFLDNAYTVSGGEGTKDLYKDWAATYEAETRANGYVTPERCATALAAVVEDKTAPLLDLGCGTGLSGEAFKAQGFTVIDGTDFSREMLDYAEGKAGVYRKLTLSDLTNPLPGAPGEYANMAAVGVFSPGHAPPPMIAEVMDKLPSGGCFVFSLNDHALADPGYVNAIEALVSQGVAAAVFNEYGDHLPKRNLKAAVSVMRKL